MTTRLLNRLKPILVACSLLVLLGAAPASALETITYLHTDIAGSPFVATDANGNVVWRESYRPYGERTKNQTASGSNRQFFHDKPFDQDSGLSYFGARYYDPVVGRFMGVDPKGFSESNLHSFNRYAYGNDNPLRFLDPNGLESVATKDRIYIWPQDPSVPRVTLPNNVGAQGIDPNSWFFHQYDVPTSSSLSAEAAGRGLQNSPTPELFTRPTPATREGAINAITQNAVVRSYSVPSPDPKRYTDIVVNYTVAGKHALEEGFVIRFGEINRDGSTTLRSYGEGNNWKQAPPASWVTKPVFDSFWRRNQQDIINNAR